MAEVPFVDLARIHEPLMTELQAAMFRVAQRGDFILGEAVAGFEKEFATYCGATHGIGVGCGTSALELLLKAHGIGQGDEVIVPASTFYATAYAVVAVGAQVVLADCDLEDGNLNPESAEHAVTERTKAILVVHLYGRPAKMEALSALCRRQGILLLEDACQAHGAYFDGKRAGSLGDGAAFSFYPAKNLGCFGDGGMVVTDDAEIAERIRWLRDFGQTEKYHHSLLGTNSRLDTLQAAVLRVKLPYLDGWNRARESAAATYAQDLGGLDLRLPPTCPPGEHVYHLYVIQSEDRDRLRSTLETQGIHTGLHYPVPIHQLEAFAYLEYKLGAFPCAEQLARTALSLPMFPGISESEQSQVIQGIRSALLQ